MTELKQGLAYIQQTHSLDVLIAISNKQGMPLSEYTNGCADKTKVRRIYEAEKAGFITLSREPLNNTVRPYMTRKGWGMVDLFTLIASLP